MKWSDQVADELHKPVISHFRKRHVVVGGVDKIWAADLIDMQGYAEFNDGVRYLLTVIDVFSKFGWIVPIQKKTGKCVAEGFKQIFKERTCDKLELKCWVDNGLEFYNKDVKNLGVELYSTNNEEKSCVVERWNRTMKEKMFKYFTANNTYRYVDVLDEMVSNYNNTRHSSTKMTPVEASQKKNEKIVWMNLYGHLKPFPQRKPKFKLNDKVRITKKKTIFDKSYIPRWTTEVFSISQIQFTDPITYKITDYNNEEIVGTFYEQELQKTNQEIYRIEKVIKRKGTKSLVKWLGYPDSFNSWVDNKKLLTL